MEFVFAAIIIGLLPAYIARGKGKDFVMWWIYGAALFIIALPHSILMKADIKAVENNKISEGGKKCPYCAEIVKREAVVCRFCQRDLPQEFAKGINAEQTEKVEKIQPEAMYSEDIVREASKLVERLKKYGYSDAGFNAKSGKWIINSSSGNFEQSIDDMSALLKNFEKQ